MSRYYFCRLQSAKGEKIVLSWRIRQLRFWQSPVKWVNQVISELEKSGHTCVDLLDVRRV